MGGAVGGRPRWFGGALALALPTRDPADTHGGPPKYNHKHNVTRTPRHTHWSPTELHDETHGDPDGSRQRHTTNPRGSPRRPHGTDVQRRAPTETPTHLQTATKLCGENLGHPQGPRESRARRTAKPRDVYRRRRTPTGADANTRTTHSTDRHPREAPWGTPRTCRSHTKGPRAPTEADKKTRTRT